MKKITFLIITLIYWICPTYAKDIQEDKNPQTFKDFSHYIETFEINEEYNDVYLEEENKDFEQNAIKDISDRYEANAVELNLDNIDDDAIDSVNNKVFKLQVNETQFNIENKIKAENMIWDSSKSFINANKATNKMPLIPDVVNSQSLNIKISPCLSASLGQSKLNDSLGTSVLFVKSNESKYNAGSVLSYKGNSINVSAGSFASSYDNHTSGGAMLSSNSINLPKKAGSFILGSAVYANEGLDCNKTSSGFFSEYSFKRLKLNVQVAQNHYSNANNTDTNLYFIPEYKLTDSLFVKTKLIRNVTQENLENELALTYKPKKSKNNLEFEINASRHYTQNEIINQKIKFSASFKI